MGKGILLWFDYVVERFDSQSKILRVCDRATGFFEVFRGVKYGSGFALFNRYRGSPRRC